MLSAFIVAVVELVVLFGLGIFFLIFIWHLIGQPFKGFLRDLIAQFENSKSKD